ncbi:MAG TPA: undecaprenyldiphospho-muramoylpentapeptide beta-N-acetylglucosaminyltransferase [Bryobacteraceae bacterium]|nr:undecaprenyldiphospho-muramoylpentapeptide beta-N-acetylglucosaminyltransferase [Bryobacteraceae bacterium]
MKIRIRQTYKKERAGRPRSGRALKLTFLMTGGGTGGHVIPAIAVARELRRRGHSPFFVGTREGLESKLVPPENMPLEFITIGGLKRVGLRQTLRTLWRLPAAILRAMMLIRRYRPAAVFSMGGYVAGPPTIAAWLMRRPVVLMEPNAMPGMANRYMARLAARACLSFPEAKQYFPAERVEMTGLPVRAEFFSIARKAVSLKLTVLVTGGSRGSRRLNEAGKASWAIFQAQRLSIRWIHQTGSQDYAEMAAAFTASGSEGQVVPFLENMPEAFAQSDLIVCRSGAGAVAELAAAGKPSILVPFPFAADQHQLHNAEAMSKAGAARLILDHELTGEELFHAIQAIASDAGRLERMGEAAKQFARPSAAARTVEILEEEAARSL